MRYLSFLKLSLQNPVCTLHLQNNPFQLGLVPYQGLHSHVWLVVTISDNIALGVLQPTKYPHGSWALHLSFSLSASVLLEDSQGRSEGPYSSDCLFVCLPNKSMCPIHCGNPRAQQSVGHRVGTQWFLSWINYSNTLFVYNLGVRSLVEAQIFLFLLFWLCNNIRIDGDVPRPFSGNPSELETVCPGWH